jgi:hypothetical protein
VDDAGAGADDEGAADGAEAEGPVEPADDPAAPLVLEAGLLLFGLGGAGFIDRDFTTNEHFRPAKPMASYLSYIRHKI